MLIKPTEPSQKLIKHIEMMPKAFSYVRFSSKRQATGDSYRRQIELSRAYAAENNLQLQNTTYEDLGISAFDGSNIREGALSAFISACENGLIPRGSFLLVEHLDRISREEVRIGMELILRLANLGIRIVSLASGKILDEKTVNELPTVMQMLLEFATANEESEKKSVRIKQAHQRKRDERNPFSFGQGPGWLTPNSTRTGWDVDDSKAASVVKVFELAAKGVGCTSIAKIANKEKWPVPGKADSWHNTLPSKLLHNRRVLGEFEPSIKNPEKKKNDDHNWQPRIKTGECWTNYYPQVISTELFNAAQAATVSRRTYAIPFRRDKGYHNLFQGILKCGHCGATLSRKSSGSARNSPGYALYVCADTNRGKSKCPSWNAKELNLTLIPSVIECVSDEILTGSIKEMTIKKLDQVRAEYFSDEKRLKSLINIAEETGGTPHVNQRIIELEKSIESHKDAMLQYSAQAEAFESEIKVEDIEEEIAKAIDAVMDITDKSILIRSNFHKLFSRALKSIHVWPNSHAVFALRSHSEAKILVPFHEEALEMHNSENLFFMPFVGPVQPEAGDEIVLENSLSVNL